MPPKPKPKVSTSKDLVATGPKEVFSNAATKPGKRAPQEKATTTRALVLRNGKYGARGTGEVMLMSRMSGREKMDLLAEDLIERSKKALITPLNLERSMKLAESQCDAYVDDIADMRDPELFRNIVETEISARNDPSRKEPRKNPTHVAKLVATRVHNSFMLASAWKIVSETLNNLAVDGLSDKNVKLKLKNDVDMRDRYLVLYDMVNTLVDVSQDRFSVLATTTPRYSRYFRLKPNESSDPGDAEYIFDFTDLRAATDSYIDSIIIELCFPNGTYPKAILYQLLREATEESRREAKHFPQTLWDAVGDLSACVDLQMMLEAPLFGPDGDAWKKQPRNMPEEYENWIDAQFYSQRASDMVANFKDLMYPLEKTRKKSVLDDIWKAIQQNYISVSGQDADSLWGLSDAFNYAPQWSSYFFPGLAEESDNEDMPRLSSNNKSKKKKPLAITDGNESHNSMPGLQSVSNTSDSDDFDEYTDEDDSDEEEEESGSEGYDTEQEDEIRDLLREAMDAAHEADWLDTSNGPPPELDPFQQEDRKGNPFLKLLGSLRGRMFSSNAKLKTPTIRTEPRSPPVRGAFRATPSGVPKNVPPSIPPKPAPKPAQTPAQPAPPKSQRATVEDVDDDDDVASVASKKKKKKKSKKKKSATGDGVPSSPTPSVQSFTSVSTTAPAAPAKNAAAPVSSPKKAAPAVSAPSYASSTTSLPLGQTTAQSAHSYLQQLNIKSEKKVKSRPDHSSLFSNPEEEKKGFFSKFSSQKKDKGDDDKAAKQSWFSKLGKKTTGLMHQLLQTSEDQTDGRAPMKWEQFLKLMREMGFTYDPSTAGSSVRFDPPNKNDWPITFHKPHPDPTIQPVMLKKFARRLKRYYGWNEEDLLRV
ncbi:unnamed protein product [Cyclocybe aegerita]|uniref:Uncharacterized protein n=1 Tax=Cyclocybe aegerita TaxID=1973307 RepID=A0A8S0VQZ9_CYCAE|nr:unnamed protein product [Cyclocybe aegerita]